MKSFHFPGRVLLAILTCVSGCSASQNAESPVEQALLQQNWTEVARAATEWKRLDSKPVVADWLLGYAALATGDYPLATKCFSSLSGKESSRALVEWSEAFVKENPKSAIAQMLRGDALARQGEYTRALVSLDDALRLDPACPLIYNVRGIVRVLADRPEMACADFEKSISLDPTFVDPLVNLGVLRLVEGDLAAARLHLENAIATGANHPLGFNARGALQAQVRSWSASETDFDRARTAAPEIAFLRSNLQLASWEKANEQFRSGRQEEATPVPNAMPTPAEPFERHVVDIGDARTVDVIVFKSTPQTANVEGIEAAFRQVTAGLCEELGVSGALNGRPRILIVQPGPGSDAFIERQNIAKMAFLAGRDFAVSMDLTDSFQRSAHLDAAQVVRIREGDSRRFERLVVAANRVCAAPPDVVLESHATRLLLRGQAESVTIADLHAQGKLRSDFRLGRVAMVGVPVGGEQGDTAFQASRIGGLVAITTRQSETVGPRLGHTPAERLQGTPSIEVWQRNQTPPSHAALFAGRWHGSQVNPIPELVGLYLRGNDAASVQKYADQLRGGAPIVRSLGTDSPEKLFRTVATVRRGLTDPARDSVLIGCKNIEHGTLAKAMYGDGWRVEVVPEQSLSRLQQMATATGFTRVHIVADDRGDSTGDHEASTGSQFPLPMGLDTPPPAFPEHRALAKNYDRAINALKLIFKLAGKEDILDVFEPSWQLIGPAHEDMQDLQDGQYRGFLMSRTRERAAKVAVSKLASILLGKDGTFAKVIDDLIASGRLPKKFGMVKGGWWVGSLTEVIAGASTQIGRGALVPTVAELECYLKAINSACWGIVGGLLSGGNPKAAEAAAIAADLTRDFLADLTEPVFKWWAYRPVRRQMIRDYEIYLERARASGIKPKRFSDMFGFKALKEAGFDEDMIEELDSRADIEIALRRATRRALARRMPSVCGPAQSGGGTSGSDRSRCFPPGFPPPPPPPPPAVAFLVDANLLVWPPDDDDHHDDDPPPPPGGGGARWSDNGGLPPPDGGSGKRRGNDDPPPPGGDPKSNNRFEDNSGGDRRSDDNNPPPNDPGGGKRKPAKVYTDQFGRIVEEYNDHQWVLKKDARGRIVSFKIRILVNGKWRDLDLPDDVYYEILKLIQAGHNVEIVVVRQGHGQIIYIYVDGELRWIITVGPDGKIIDIKRGGVRVRADVRMSQYGEKADTTGWFAFEEDKSAGFSEPLFESTASSTPHRAAPKRTAFLCPFTLFSASPVTER